MHRICVRAVGLFEEPVCLDLRECISVGDLVAKVFDLRGVKTDLEVIAVSDGFKTLKFSEDACSYKELIVFRLFRGG
ncbi:MAG: hypothetical protein QXV93_04155 [Zestosphaera sp.]